MGNNGILYSIVTLPWQAWYRIKLWIFGSIDNE